MKRTRAILAGLSIMVLAIFLVGCAARQQVTTPEEAPDSTQVADSSDVAPDSLAFAQEQARQDSLQQVQEQERLRVERERIAKEQREAQLRKEKAAKAELKVVHFAFDQSKLSTEARATLQKNAEILLEYAGWKVIIEGHTDERGATEYNLALGERRADVVKQYYVSYGVDEKRIEMISYGEERPVEAGSGEAIWLKNRRAVTKVK